MQGARISGFDCLGRFYTVAETSDLLVEQLADRQFSKGAPDSVVDLGCGAGVLSKAVARRWSTSRLITVDVDRSAGRVARMSLASHGRHHHISGCALDIDLPSRIASVGGVCDMAVCNPPFVSPEWRPEFSEILLGAGLGRKLPANSLIEAPELFLAQNLRVLSTNGRLGIILPDSHISAKRYRWFRESLLLNFFVKKVIKLPRGSFEGTDALGHILIVEKAPSASNTVELGVLRNGVPISICSVDLDRCVDRMDGEYHQKINSDHARAQRLTSILGDVGTVCRGGIENARAKLASVRVVHTTDLPCDRVGEWLDFPECSYGDGELPGVDIALPGDILLARVGRNLSEKIVGVKSGRIAISDCVYRIRVPERHRVRLLRKLSSRSGREWLRVNSYGVGAAQLPKSALLGFTF